MLGTIEIQLFRSTVSIKRKKVIAPFVPGTARSVHTCNFQQVVLISCDSFGIMMKARTRILCNRMKNFPETVKLYAFYHDIYTVIPHA